MARQKKTVSDGANVFADLGLEDSAELNAKAALVFQLGQIIKQRKLTQVAAGKLLGVNQSEVSRLLRGELDNFSMQKLLDFAMKLNRDVEIALKPRSRGIGHMTVVTT